MGYPQRFFVPGYVWHLTGRCHGRNFLLDRVLYRKLFVDALFEAKERYLVPILNFTVTSNHFHILAVSTENKDAISAMIRDISSKVAATYNKKTGRKGSFWERRYHATAVETGEHLVRCSLYIDTNMVRAGVVRHPKEWKHCGVHEIIKPKQRYKLINVEEFSRLAGMPGDPTFPKHYADWVDNAVRKGCLARDEVWTMELAVGNRKFVDHVRRCCGYSSPVNQRNPSLKETPASYAPLLQGYANNTIEWTY